MSEDGCIHGVIPACDACRARALGERIAWLEDELRDRENKIKILRSALLKVKHLLFDHGTPIQKAHASIWASVLYALGSTKEYEEVE